MAHASPWAPKTAPTTHTAGGATQARKTGGCLVLRRGWYPATLSRSEDDAGVDGEDAGPQHHLAEGTSEQPAEVPRGRSCPEGDSEARALCLPEPGAPGAQLPSSRSTASFSSKPAAPTSPPPGRPPPSGLRMDGTGMAVAGTPHTVSQALPQTAGSGARTPPGGMRAGARAPPAGPG